MSKSTQELLEKQKAYYQARASQYDEWFYRWGRYDFGPKHTRQWEAEAQLVRQQLADQNLTGNVLEFAAGTGIWTQELLKTATHITALDASEEVLVVNKAKTQSDKVTYQVADIFVWQAPQPFDAAFMGFWLSHIPPSKQSYFMNQLANTLQPGGKIFFIDSLPKPSSTAKDMAADLAEHASRTQSSDEESKITRRLNDGQEFELVKVYYQPDDLAALFEAHQMQVTVKRTDNFFLYGWGTRL